jgi:hypothetical protein
MAGRNLSQHRPRHLLRGLLMRFNVWLLREDDSPSPLGPSQITSPYLVTAQRLAAETLQELQRDGALVNWSIQTITEA